MDLLPQQPERQLDGRVSLRGRGLGLGHPGRGRARGRDGHAVSYSYARAEVNVDDAPGRGRQRTVSQPHAQGPAHQQLYDPYADGPGSSHAFHALDSHLDFTRRGSIPAQRNAGQFLPRMSVPDALMSAHPESAYGMGAVGYPPARSAPATANPNVYTFDQSFAFDGSGGGARGSVQFDKSDSALETVFRVDPSRAPVSTQPPGSAILPEALPTVWKPSRAARRRRTVTTTDAVVILPVDPLQLSASPLPVRAENADPTPAIKSLYLGAMREKEVLEEMDYQHSAWQLALGEPVARSVSPAMQLSLLYWFAHFGGKGKLTPTVRGAYASCAQAIHERGLRRARRLGARNGASFSSSSSAKA